MPAYVGVIIGLIAFALGVGAGVRWRAAVDEAEFHQRTHALQASRNRLLGIMDGVRYFAQAVAQTEMLGHAHPLRIRARHVHAVAVDALAEDEPAVAARLVVKV